MKRLCCFSLRSHMPTSLPDFFHTSPLPAQRFPPFTAFPPHTSGRRSNMASETAAMPVSPTPAEGECLATNPLAKHTLHWQKLRDPEGSAWIWCKFTMLHNVRHLPALPMSVTRPPAQFWWLCLWAGSKSSICQLQVSQQSEYVGGGREEGGGLGREGQGQ